MDGIVIGFNSEKGFFMDEYVRPKRERTYKGESLVSLSNDYVIIDIETTGLWPDDKILEIGAIRYSDQQKVESFQTFIAPYFDPGESRDIRDYIPPDIERLTGISYDMLKDAPKISDALKDFSDFIREDTLVAHNANFDINFLYDNMERFLGTYLTNNFIDTLRISRKVFPEFFSHSMSALIDQLHIDKGNQHRAIDDCLLCNTVYSICCKEVEKIGPDGWAERFKRKSDRPATKIQPSDKYNPVPECRFYDKTVAFTGTLSSMDRKEAMQLVVDIGGYVGDNVTKKTDFLVMGIQDYHKFADGKESNKTKKVKELKQKGQIIHILSEDDFFKILFNLK